ncbi:unknown [Collinsella sp. CAG:289]|nr:unknown [Collinsella sp. CAG:289]
MAERQTRVPQEHVGIARAGSSPAAPTKTLNQDIRTGGLFHAFDYQLDRHCSKTYCGKCHTPKQFDYQLDRHCSKT